MNSRTCGMTINIWLHLPLRSPPKFQSTLFFQVRVKDHSYFTAFPESSFGFILSLFDGTGIKVFCPLLLILFMYTATCICTTEPVKCFLTQKKKNLKKKLCRKFDPDIPRLDFKIPLPIPFFNNQT